MKKNVEKRERTVVEEVVTYVANDGTVFKSEEECKKYEVSAMCAVKALFNGVKQYEEYGDTFLGKAAKWVGSDDSIYTVCFDSLSDIEATNKWLQMVYGQNGDKTALFSSSDLGTIQIIQAYDDCFWQMGTPDDVKKRFCDHIDEMVARAKGEFEKKEDK